MQTEHKIQNMEMEFQKEEEEFTKRSKKTKHNKTAIRQCQSDTKEATDYIDKDKVIIKIKKQYEAEIKLIKYKCLREVEEAKLITRKQETSAENYREENEYLRTELEKFKGIKKVLSTREKELTQLKADIRNKELQSEFKEASKSVNLNSRMVSSFTLKDFQQKGLEKLSEYEPDSKFKTIENMHKEQHQRNNIHEDQREENKKMKVAITTYKEEIDGLRASQMQESIKMVSALSSNELEVEILKKKIEHMEIMHVEELQTIQKDHEFCKEQIIEIEHSQHKQLEVENNQYKEEICRLKSIIREKAPEHEEQLKNKQNRSYEKQRQLTKSVSIEKHQIKNEEQKEFISGLQLKNEQLKNQISLINEELEDARAKLTEEHKYRVEQQIELRRIQIMHQESIATIKCHQEQLNERYRQAELDKQELQSKLNVSEDYYQQELEQQQIKKAELQDELEGRKREQEQWRIKLEQNQKLVEEKEIMILQLQTMLEQQQGKEEYKGLETQIVELEEENVEKSELIELLRGKIERMEQLHSEELNNYKEQAQTETALLQKLYEEKLEQNITIRDELEKNLALELEKVREELAHMIEKDRRQRMVWKEVFNQADNYNKEIGGFRTTHKNM